jgi:hypothetical protein
VPAEVVAAPVEELHRRRAVATVHRAAFTCRSPRGVWVRRASRRRPRGA